MRSIRGHKYPGDCQFNSTSLPGFASHKESSLPSKSHIGRQPQHHGDYTKYWRVACNTRFVSAKPRSRLSANLSTQQRRSLLLQHLLLLVDLPTVWASHLHPRYPLRRLGLCTSSSVRAPATNGSVLGLAVRCPVRQSL